MRKQILICMIISGLVAFSFSNLLSQAKPPYPIIFVHGLIGSDETFKETMEYMRYQFNWGEIGVFDVVLNADNDNSTALIDKTGNSGDVRWENFRFDSKLIRLGRRNYVGDIDDYTHLWTSNITSIFAINFAEERIEGAYHGGLLLSDLFDHSNEAAIYKQGLALKQMIISVREFTGSDKVILIGHSMGGLAIREYLQRTDDGTIYSDHTWWITQEYDGHEVARVVTIGTPHLGCNSFETIFKTSSGYLPNLMTEAIRDLRYSYNIFGSQGRYLFGGNESISQSFHNCDINCNGDENDEIIGINNDTYVNPNIPLPQNIFYTWITSDYGTGGDLVVDLSRQWLYSSIGRSAPVGYSDTLLTDKWHGGEGKDFKSILRGMDEPDDISMPYEIQASGEYISGLTTYQPFGDNTDVDYFRFIAEYDGTATVTIQEISNHNNWELNILDIASNSITSIDQDRLYYGYGTLSFNIHVNDSYFIKIQSDATDQTFANPYSFKVTTSPTQYASGDHIAIESYIWEGGDDDGVPEVGEDVDLRLRVRSGSDIIKVTATLITGDSQVEITDSVITYDSIDAGTTVSSEQAFDINLNISSPKTCVFNIRFTYECAGISYFKDFPFSKEIINQENWVTFDVVSFEIDDSKSIDSRNNEDGIIQSGEHVNIKPLIKNTGISLATKIDVYLAYDNTNLEFETGYERYPNLNPNETNYPSNDNSFYIRVEPNFTGSEFVGVVIECSENSDTLRYSHALELSVEPEAWLSLTTEEINSGSIRTGFTATETFGIKNIGSKVMIVSEVQSSHDDVSVDIPELPITIYPGKSWNVDVSVQSEYPENIDAEITIFSDARTYDTNKVQLTCLVSDSIAVYQVPGISACRSPDISENIIVYSHNYDIYNLNILSGNENAICTDIFSQRNPRISDNIIVWQDLRNWSGTGDVNCDIYGYDLEFCEEFEISKDPANERLIGISDGKILFLRKYYEFTENSNWGGGLYNLWMYDNSTKLTTNITNFTSNDSHNPMYTIDDEDDFNGGMFVSTKRKIYWDTYRWFLGDYNMVKMKIGEDSSLVSIGSYNYDDLPTTNGSKIAWYKTGITGDDEIWIWENGNVIEYLAEDDIDYKYPVIGENYIVYEKKAGSTYQLMCKKLADGKETMLVNNSENIDKEYMRIEGDNIVLLTTSGEIYYSFLDGYPDWITSIEDTFNQHDFGIVNNYTLNQNYPNPFNPQTTIRFALPAAEDVHLEVFDLRGRLVRTLASGMMPAGEHAVIWDGTNSAGQPVSSGMYFYKLQAGQFTAVKKMLLVK